MSPDVTLAVLLGVLGLLVGSFLNVCIHRLPRDQSVAFPASHCPSCERPLRWYHNVPVVSWLALGGRGALDERDGVHLGRTQGPLTGARGCPGSASIVTAAFSAVKARNVVPWTP